MDILITDTHFGVKQNSMTWLNSQMDFFYKQFIPYIKSLHGDRDYIRIIHCGDVFDSRSSISVIIASRVRQLFIDLSDVCDDIIIIGGNHDYYSHNTDAYDSLNLLLNNIPKVRIVTKKLLRFDEDLFLPWYECMNLDENVYDGIKRIFMHSDIVQDNKDILTFIKKRRGIKLFSGHIHIPSIDEERGLYNLGSCFSLDFSDSNQVRGFYVFDNEKLTFIPNNISLRFWRLYNDDIFNEEKLGELRNGDYIELYIDKNNLDDSKYTDIINGFINKYKNFWVIPIGGNGEWVIDNMEFDYYNIENIIDELIPENLKYKFELIKQKLNELQ